MILSTPTDLAHHRRGGWATPVLLGACCCAALGFSIAFPLVGEACDPVDECTVQKCIDETDVNIEVDDDQWVVSGHDDEGQVRWRIQLTGLDPDDAPTIVRDGRFVHVREGKRERATIDVTDGRLIERAADPIAVAPNTIFVSDPETGRRLFTIGDGRDDRIAALEKELARREAELRRIEERLAQARAQEAGDDPHRDHEHARRLHEEELRAHEETLRAHEHSLRLQELEMRAAEERRELAERSDRLRAELADREAMLENRHHELVARLEEHLARGEMEAARRMEALIAKLGPEQEDRRRAMASALADMERALVDQRNELENRFHEQFEHARDAAQESMRAAARMSHSGEEIAALTARSLDAVQAQLAEKNHQLSMLPEALTDLRDAVRTIESQLAHVTRGLDRVAARADSGGSSGAVEEMKQLVADLENALSVERTRNADLASENARLRARIAALEGDGDR